MFSFRHPQPKSDTSPNLEMLLRHAAPEWWQDLPEASRRILLDSRTKPPESVRSSRHLLWHTGDALVQQAQHILKTAESVALAALSAQGNAIDEMLTYTVLIRVYSRQPDLQERCVEICYRAIEHAGAFREAWRKRAEQHNLPIDESAMPRLEAFDWLIAYYEMRRDVESANDICRRAVSAGYPEYQQRIRAERWRYAAENAGAFLRGMLALGATRAALQLQEANSPELEVAPVYMVMMFVLWGVTIGLAVPSVIRELLLEIPRALRRRPALFWLISLLLIIGIPMHSELLKFNALFQGYDTWMLLWGGSLLLFAGFTFSELRDIGRRLSASRYSGVLVTLTTLAILLIAGELILRYGVIFSNSYARGMIHQRWVDHYWNPLNALDYRDNPPYIEVPDGIQRILVVGDSFAAGFGVNDIGDTFPHLLVRLMGENYRVNVAGVPGWNTRGEFEGLKTYPYRPDTVIWSYFLNDIADVDPTYEKVFDELFAPPPMELQPYVDRFYLGEFLYWNLYRQMFSGGDSGYGDLVRSAYARPELWQEHRADLEAVIDYSNENSIRLVVIIWPVLTGVEQSEAMTRQVEGVFTSRNIPVVNMVDVVKGYGTSQLVVNPLDMHPGVLAQRLAADALFKTLTSPPPRN